MDDAEQLSEALTLRCFDIMVAQVNTVRWPFVLISGVMALLATRAVPVPWVGAWLATVLLVFGLRNVWLTRQSADPDVPALRKVRGALLSNLALGLSYGLSAAFMLVLDQTTSAVLTTIAVSSAAGAVAISGTLPRVYLAYTLGIMIPFGGVWAVEGSLLGLALAVLMGMFVTLQYRFAQQVSDTFKESFLIRRRNEVLVAELTLARDQAHAASLAKTRFLAAASHDLRQPMHALSLQSGSLLRNPHAECTPVIAAAIAKEISNVNTLLNSLLDMSKLDAGTLVADCRPIHLSRMLESLAHSFRTLVEARGLRFELNLVPDQIAVTDPILLERVLRNLVENAIKFTPQGEVRLSLQKFPTHFELSVSDTGMGIPTEAQAKVFDEFYQIDRHARGDAQGLGLGLSIVSRLSTLLGMGVTLESTLAVGTTIRLRMPCGEPDAAPAAAAPDGDAGEAPASEPDEELALDAIEERLLRGQRVLILDDERSICEAEAELLRAWGCEVATACSAAEALATARSFRPSAVLADYRLRNSADGVAAVVQLRAEHPGLRALLLSGDTGPDRLREAQASGLRLLSKPVEAERLRLALIELVLEPA